MFVIIVDTLVMNAKTTEPLTLSYLKASRRWAQIDAWMDEYGHVMKSVTLLGILARDFLP